ncbi:hypothetical protein TrVFT333_006921 [Trichoderma virens FT-333]|nr:hypothetical protein TrVFT333_006921 [Trichoderma virens FT-333]
MDQPSVNSHDPSWVEEDVREREAIAAWDHDEQWPSVQKPPFHIDKAREFDSRLTVLGEPGQLGRGGFGRVDKVIYGSVSLARKCIERKGRLRNFTMEDLQQEALTMRRLNHRHVTRLPANKINERLYILGGSHQMYYNECCKRPISWTEDADDKLATLSSLRAENEDLKKKIAELYNEEEMYREQFENIQKTYEEDITNQKVLFESREKKLESDLHASNAAKSAIQKELDEAKLSLSKLAEENAACIKQHDIEFGTAKRAIAMAEGERSAMQRKIDELTSQNLELAKAIAAQRVMAQESESSSGISDEDLEAAAIDITPEHSPPQSPIEGTTRHSMLETETLKTSLQHAQ